MSAERMPEELRRQRDKAENLRDAAPELLALAASFEITGPDADGLLWLVLHGNGTTGKAMFNLRQADGIAGQVALMLESNRRAAIAKAAGSAPVADMPIPDGYYSASNEVIGLLDAALAAPEQAAQPVAEWQARVGPKGQWRRIDPTGTGETLEQRVAYLRGLKNGAGYRPYEVRALYAAPHPAPVAQTVAWLMTNGDSEADWAEAGAEQPTPEPGFTAVPLGVLQPAPVALQPLTEERVVMDGLMMCPNKTLESGADAFQAGVRWAEQQHGIGAQP